MNNETLKTSARVACAAVAAALVLAGSAAAQTASLAGQVTDPQGRAVPGAAVILSMTPAGSQQTGQTGADGSFAFSGLAPGEYRLEVIASGFERHVQTVTLAAGARTLDVALDIAAVREEVTVQGIATVPTIGRVSAPLRDQPLTVNTITAEELEAHAINDVVTALQRVPNVNAYTNYGVYQYFTFRGFDESIQMVDGIRNEGNRVRTQLANVERIEVLKGPASVLYGAGAIGGTVNLVLKKPSPEPVYEASAAAGRWETFRGTFGAAGRLGGRDDLFYRVDIAGESADNYRQDPSKRLNVTPSLTWRASNVGQLDVRYYYDRNRVSGDSGIPLVPLEGGFVPDPARTNIGDPLSRAISSGDTAAIPVVPMNSRYNTPQDFGLGSDHNLRATYAHLLAGRFGFRDTIGYRANDDEYFLAEFLDVTPPSTVNRGFLYFDHHRRPVTNQAELSGRFRLGVDHDVLVGWDYQHYRSFTDRRADANFNTTPIDLYDPVETHQFVDVHSFPVTRIDYTTTRSHGLFFQDTLALGSQVKVVLGGRFDRIDRSTHRNPVENGIETMGPVDEADFEDYTYRSGLVYQPIPALDLYVQNSTSFEPTFTVQADGTPLEPEYGVQYEVGQRLRLARLELNAAVFHIDKRNLTRSLGGQMFEQIGKLRSRGFEAEIAGLLAPRWTVNLGYGFTAAKFLDYVTSSGVDLSGNRPRRTPRHTLTFSTTYGWANGLSIMAGGRLRSDEFLTDDETLAFNGYEVIDLGVSYTRGRVQYALNLTNVTDQDYWASSLGPRQLYPGQPFNAIATVRVRMD